MPSLTLTQTRAALLGGIGVVWPNTHQGSMACLASHIVSPAISTYASVIRRNAFSPDKGLSGENWRGGARTAAEQPPESKTWDFPKDFPKCAGAGGWRKAGWRGPNRRWPFESPPHCHSAAAALLLLRKLLDIDLSTEK